MTDSSVSRPLTPIEIEAMAWLKRHDGVLISQLEDKTETDVLGFRQPGLNVFKRLAKLDLCYISEEDPMFEDEPALGTWTPGLYLTEAGRTWVEPPPAPAKPRKPRS